MDETLAVENKTLVDKLYSLRAGLSLVATKNDEIKEERQKYNHSECQWNSTLNSLEDQKARLLFEKGKLWDSYQKENNNIKKEINELKKELVIRKIKFRDYPIKEKLITIIVSPIIMLLMAVFLFPVFVWVLVGYIREKIKNKREIKKKQELLESLEAKLETEDSLRAKFEKDARAIAYNKELDEIEEKLKKHNAAFDTLNEEKRQCYNKIDIIKNSGIQLHNALISEYSSTLDYRDWSNIDLIIYNMETGRADTLKEALQQVDNYRNTEKIVGAIIMATQAICNTISLEQDRMIRLVSNCTDAINSRLDTLDSSMKSLIKVEEMKNAMLKKSNLTSDELVKEIKLLRESI